MIFSHLIDDWSGLFCLLHRARVQLSRILFLIYYFKSFPALVIRYYNAVLVSFHFNMGCPFFLRGS